MKNFLYKYKYFYLQSIELLPFVLILLQNSCFKGIQIEKLALFIGLISVCIEIFYKIIYRSFLPMFGAVSLSLLQFAILRFFFNIFLSFVSNTILLAILLFVNVLIVRKLYSFSFYNYSKSYYGNKMVIDNAIYEFLYMSRLLLYILGVYLFIIVIYSTSLFNFHQDIYDFLNYRLIFILLIAYFIYECIRIILLNKMLSKEIWLPIVNKSFRTIGKIEKQESADCRNSYLHPHIRIIIMYKNQIYLQLNQIKNSLSGLRWDTPISLDLHYKESPDSILINSILKKYIVSENKKRCHKILTYQFKTDTMNRLIMLYVVNLSDELHMNRSCGGKFWTPSQIEEELNKNVFSNCFEQEYEFLKNTVLLAWKYMKEKEEDKE